MSQEDKRVKETADKGVCAKRLRKLTESIEVFHDADGACFARIPVNGHYEVVELGRDGSGLQDWLTYAYVISYKLDPSATAITDRLKALHSLAMYGEEKAAHVRVAGRIDEAIYIDMCDRERHVIKVTAKEVTIIEATECPYLFRRTKGMLALPRPEEGGNVGQLWDVVRKPEGDYGAAMMVFWLLSTCYPGGPFPVLDIHGPHGSSKSKAAEYLRRVIDPHSSPVEAKPEGREEAFILASQTYVNAYDNVSSISLEMSDVFCQISTGSTYRRRTKYANSDVSSFSACRPIILNGIGQAATNDDILSRILNVHLPPIQNGDYKTVAEVERRFHEIHPQLLGALLHGVMIAMRRYDQIEVATSSRLADFQRFATAAEEALGFKAGTVAGMMAERAEEATAKATLGSVVTRAVLRFMENRPAGYTYSRSVADFYEDITTKTSGGSGGSYLYIPDAEWKDFPGGANWFGVKLDRSLPTLREHGIVVDKRRRGKGEWITLRNSEERVRADEEEARPNETPTQRWGREQEEALQGLGLDALMPDPV